MTENVERAIFQKLPPIMASKLRFYGIVVFAVYIGAYILGKNDVTLDFGGFPESLVWSIQKPIDAVFEWTGNNLSWFFGPISDVVDATLTAFEDFLLWIPWTVVIISTGLFALKVSNWRMSLFCSLSLLFIGLLGLWDSAMITVSLMGISVLLAVVIGVPLGIAASFNDRFEAATRPILDVMQVMPAFVYLMPALFLFGVGGTVSIFLTVVYAIPPAIRLTNLGIRQVPQEIVETSKSHGSTALQTLLHVQLPMAKPSVMMGINQTIMMALAMVIITALVGAPGLGHDVWTSLSRIDSGSGFEAGFAIVLLAIIVDRLSFALARQGTAASSATSVDDSPVSIAAGYISTSGNFLIRNLFLSAGVTSIFLLLVLGVVFSSFSDFPDQLTFSIANAINYGVDWMAVNLYSTTSWVRDSVIREFGLMPVQTLLNATPWPVLVITASVVAFIKGGWKVAILALCSTLFFGFAGVWDLAMHTLSQVLVAVVLAVFGGVLIGIWASQSDSAQKVLRPILDSMQTMPVFVYLIPVIMLWSAGPITSIIATVIYALPPAIRMTNLGMRSVPTSVLDTASSHGATRLQSLIYVQIPLARPTIMMGINQTIIMALAMVIIGGLIGGGGLGEEVYVSSVYMEMGQGLVAGFAIVLLATVLDRMTQGQSEHDLQKSSILG